MRNKKARPADIKRHLNEEIKDESPFSGIVLKEKKTEAKPERKPVPKKPSEIVQGYNPNASFADILFSYEHTGNPYSMPESRKKKIAEKKTDFASILAEWEGTGTGKKKASGSQNQKKSVYKPTKSFEDILSQYEGRPAESKKDRSAEHERKAKSPARPDESGPYERHSAAYKPSKDFSEILSSFDNPRGRDDSASEKAAAAAEPLSESLFRTDSEYERAPEASWSVLGGNDSFVRPEKKDAAPIKEKETVKAVSAPYKPSKDFSEILSEYENGRASASSSADDPIAVLPPAEKIEAAETSSMFRKETEDERRAPGAAWSVFGGNETFVRKEHSAEADVLPQVEIPCQSHYRPSSDFASILSDYEKEDIKTFDEIMKEKGDSDRKKAQLTLPQLRLMKPQATLDLHQLTQNEAEDAILSFLSECHENGIRKISIITGKGLHSEDGIGILRSVADRVLDESGLVSEKKSAPQNAGGSGALWIILKA